MYDLPVRVGRWTVERLIGRGGMATVLLAVDDAVDPPRYAAIKWLHAGSARIRARFAREVRVLGQIDHRCVVRVYESGEWLGRPYVALEWIDGPDLAQHAVTLRTRPPAERVARVRGFARDLCEALACVHDHGLVHRDVKPANVLLAPDGRAVLTDFGVVADLDSADPVTQSGTLVGTAAWASPEQLESADVDGRADQYGLGATLYLLLTGQRPVDAVDAAEILRQVLAGRVRPPSALDPTVPADLEAFVLRLMNRAPADRFPDMHAALAALGPAAPSGLPLAGRQPAIDALARVLDAVAAGQGRLVAVHGAPRSGRAWLAGVARDSGARRGVRVVTADDPLTLDAACDRLDAGEPLLVLTAASRSRGWSRRAPDDVIELAPLSLADMRRSTHALAPRTADLAGVADQLHRWSGGNPGLFLALVEACRHGDALTVGLAPPLVDAAPFVDDLDLDTLTVAGALAAVSGSIDRTTLAHIAQVPPDEALEVLTERGIAVGAEGDQWRLLPEALRRPILDRVPDAEALEDRALALLPPDDTDDADAVLAEAHRLQASGQAAAALELLRAKPDTLPRQLLLGRLCWRAGDLDGSTAAFDAVLRSAPGGLLRARAAMGAGASALHRGDLSVALDRFTQAVTEAGMGTGGARAHLALASLNLAEARALAGDMPDALRAARRGLDIARAERERAVECLATRVLGRALLDAGQFTEAAQTLADASVLARATDLAEERLIAHVLRAELTLRTAAAGAERSAATAAQERLLPLLSQPAAGPDPEGWQALLRAVQARVLARLGDARGLQRWTEDAERRCAGVGVPGRVRVHLALGHAWSEGPPEARTEGARRLDGARLWAAQLGFRGLGASNA